MKALVVYESLWGNTARIAGAIAEGIGREARALSTAAATGDEVADADLIVAGAPVFGFKLSSEKMRQSIRANPGKAPAAPDLSHPAMRAWLAELPPGHGRSAAFDTQVRGPFGSGAPEIAELLQAAGYTPLGEPVGFMLKGKYGPLRDGEVERAREWGAELAAALA